MATCETIEAIRTLSVIEQLVAEHVQLRRSGVELVGRCPFHADKTPSFYVRPGKQAFHCFGCGAGGDVFEFVRLLHHCSFRESVEILATRAGIRINGFRPSPELAAKVSALKAQREEELAFKRFADARINWANQRHRDLGRAATHAEEYLRAGTLSDHEQDLAWSALEDFRAFQLRIEREGLCDLGMLKTEWRLRDSQAA
jgi:DNA primase